MTRPTLQKMIQTQIAYIQSLHLRCAEEERKLRLMEDALANKSAPVPSRLQRLITVAKPGAFHLRQELRKKMPPTA